jgi:hypothetical protein
MRILIMIETPIPSRPRLKVFKSYVKEIIPGHGMYDELSASLLEQDARNGILPFL